MNVLITLVVEMSSENGMTSLDYESERTVTKQNLEQSLHFTVSRNSLRKGTDASKQMYYFGKLFHIRFVRVNNSASPFIVINVFSMVRFIEGKIV